MQTEVLNCRSSWLVFTVTFIPGSCSGDVRYLGLRPCDAVIGLYEIQLAEETPCQVSVEHLVGPIRQD